MATCNTQELQELARASTCGVSSQSVSQSGCLITASRRAPLTLTKGATQAPPPRPGRAR